MTLIVTRASCRYALMVTDRRVTRNGAVFDPDANKNIGFGARNAVVAIGYTGLAYIGTIPTDQWIAQTLTGLTFPEGRRGRGTVPALMITNYEDQCWGVRVRYLRHRLNEVGPLIPEKHRQEWRAGSFDLVITGWEWNHGEARPYLASLSKPHNSDTFELSDSDRYWYVPRGMRFPVRMCAAPAQNLTGDKLASIDARLDSVWGDGHGTPSEVADHAEVLFAETIQDVSVRLNVVGPDTMSILIPPPVGSDPTIRIRYIPAGREQGVLVAGGMQMPVPVAFSPWVVSPGCIRSPVVFTNLRVESVCGPYRVVMEGPPADGMPGAMSGQERTPVGPRPLEQVRELWSPGGARWHTHWAGDCPGRRVRPNQPLQPTAARPLASGAALGPAGRGG
jgi:hypothetical protein